MKPYFILATLILALPCAVQAETFRWVDSSGKVHYGDRPPDDASQLEQKKFLPPPKDAAGKGGGANLGYEARRAQ